LFFGIERDQAALALANANIEANELGDRISARAGDIAEAASLAGEAPFDAALANPPFFDDSTRLRAPHPSRRAAWIAEEPLSVWLAALVRALKGGGTLTMIHRAERLADILAMLAPAAGSFRVRPIHPFADEPAKRVLVRAAKGGKAPLRLLPALVLHVRGGPKHTPEAEAILRGEAALAWL
jgi:tRNA1(Val) A37 N6-methylase TrmN6